MAARSFPQFHFSRIEPVIETWDFAGESSSEGQSSPVCALSAPEQRHGGFVGSALWNPWGPWLSLMIREGI